MPDCMAPGELWGLWLWDGLDMLDAFRDPWRPGICHGCSEDFWAMCHTTGSTGTAIPKFCGFLLFYGSQVLELLVGSLGLMGQGMPSKAWSHCWMRSPEAAEMVLSGLTMFWNYVNQALIISKRLLKKFPSAGNVSIHITQRIELPVPLLGRLPEDWRGWRSCCQVQGATADCSQQLQQRLMCCLSEVQWVVHCKEDTGSPDAETAAIFITLWFQREVFTWEYCAYITCVYTNKWNLKTYIHLSKCHIWHDIGSTDLSGRCQHQQSCDALLCIALMLSAGMAMMWILKWSF